MSPSKPAKRIRVRSVSELMPEDDDGACLGERFQSCIWYQKKTSGCWWWDSQTSKSGIPLYWDNEKGRLVNARNYAYRAYFRLPRNDVLIPTCPEHAGSSCVNPSHQITLSSLTPIEEIEYRFGPHVDSLDDDACWRWLGAGRRNPQLTIEGKTRGAVRWAFEMLNGKKGPKGRRLRNLCDVMFCVNPKHWGFAESPVDDSFNTKFLILDRGYKSKCHIWQGKPSDRGYGRYKQQYAHRYVWEKANGPIEPDLTIDHLCGQKMCVRLSHLEPVTRIENLHRRWERQDPQSEWQRDIRRKIRRLTDRRNYCLDVEDVQGANRLDREIKNLGRVLAAQ